MGKITKKQDTRREFINTLIELAEKDEKIVLIVPDVGFNYIEEFQKRFPNRFFNFGVTEASTMIIAAGMALSGFKPYVYSMINFVVFRSYEMLRNAVCLHNANVKVMGIKGSKGYKFLGFSHNLISKKEEIDSLKNLPIDTFIAEKPEQVRKIILDTYKKEGPAYIRI